MAAPLTFLFIGRSGCGKGTQSRLLSEFLAKRDGLPVYQLEGGPELRKHFDGESYSSRLSKAMNDRGELQPEFLSVWVWASLLVANMQPDQHLIVDGPGRRRHECEVLETAFKFYDRGIPFIIHLSVSPEWSRARMKARGRADDTPDAIERRLAWFEKETIPALEFFRNNPAYHLLEINGEQPIEKVHADIAAAIEEKIHGAR